MALKLFLVEFIIFFLTNVGIYFSPIALAPLSDFDDAQENDLR